MNEIVNKCLLIGHKFMPKMNLRQPGLRESEERILKCKETGDSLYIYQNELDKACFQHDMAYGDFKDLPRRTPSDKTLRDKAFNIAKNPKYDGYLKGFVSVVYNFIG